MILFPFLLLVLLALSALVIDMGLAYNARAQLQKATDSAALAGALKLLQQVPDEADAAIEYYLANNPVYGVSVSNVIITLGMWDDNAQSFNATDTNPTAVSVTASYSGFFYFAPIFNIRNYTVTRTSIASIVDNRPLNIMIVADLSANMSLASQLKGVGVDDVTQASVVNNLTSIYQFFNATNLFNNPDYGQMTFDQIITAGGGMSEEQMAMNTLGLDGVSYPYTGFSWLDYIQYAENLTLSNGAYQHHYGFLTLINFWQEIAYSASQTPILAQATEQPLQTVKNAVNYFSSKLNPSTDRIGLTLISNNSNLAIDLTQNYNEVITQLNSYQAGHFGTPDGVISPAIDSAQASLINNTSPNGKKIVILFANGQTLWNETVPAELYDITGLKSNNIYAYELVIGPQTYPNQSANFTLGTDGQVQAVTLGATDYTTQIDAIYNQLKLGPPRLVQ